MGIPPGARIIAVCDAFDAMTSAEAIRELLRCAETLFDPEVVETFMEVRASLEPRLVDAVAAAPSIRGGR